MRELKSMCVFVLRTHKMAHMRIIESQYQFQYIDLSHFMYVLYRFLLAEQNDRTYNLTLRHILCVCVWAVRALGSSENIAYTL